MTTASLKNQWFLPFTAGCVLIAVPITILFIFMQKYYVEGVTAGGVKG
jgi:arabinogalactan oligomer/maltooligosaccharide transport system permease protein